MDRTVNRVTNRAGKWLVFQDGKMIGDIEQGKKDFRIHFTCGANYYRLTFEEAVKLAKDPLFPTVTGKKKTAGNEYVQMLPLTMKRVESKSVPKPKGKEDPYLKVREVIQDVKPVNPPTPELLAKAITASGTPRFYFAYGANTDAQSMAYRCPTAMPAGKGTLVGWKLQFRGCADIVEAKGNSMEGVLWLIYPEDEYALDRFEGYPTGYEKVEVPVIMEDGTKIHAMVYVMTGRRRGRGFPPSHGYVLILRSGYKRFGCDLRQIDRAIKEAEVDEQFENSKPKVNWYSGEYGYE